MNDGFELLDPRNARAFLKSFGSPARRKGNTLFDQGRVLQLEAHTPGVEYRAMVEEGVSYEVVLEYDALEGWSGECACGEDLDCAHMFAAMRALLAEHSTAAVRNLSAGALPARNKSGLPEELDAAGLARRLMAAHRRPL